MERLDIRVKGLDCAEEISLLKSVLGKERGIYDLGFNLLQAKMRVTYDPQEIDSERIISIIDSTGLKAIPWEQTKNYSLWEQTKNNFLTILGLFFWIAAIVAMLVARTQDGFMARGHALPLVVKMLCLFAILASMAPIIPKAFNALRRLRPDMNLLMLLAILGAIFIQEWFEAATVASLFSVALFLENWSVRRARVAISSLMELSVPNVRLIDLASGHIEEKHVEEVSVGSTMLVRPGEKVPLDGTVIQGYSTVNQLPLTGEALPIFKQEGDEVLAGSLNEEGALVCTINKPAQDTMLARIIRLVEEARLKRSLSESFVEHFAAIYTPIMLLFALLIMVIPPLILGHDWISWIYRGLVFLVIACPCALVISTPVSIVSGLTCAARNGVLIKGGVFLEAIGKIRALALDKTGTLTHGQPVVQQIIPLNHHSESELLQRAVALEKASEHPIARAIRKKGDEFNIIAPVAENFTVFKGKGAQGFIQGKKYWIGSHRLMHEMGQETTDVHQKALELEDAGHTVIALGSEDHVCGLFSLADTPRLFARDSIEAIRELGIKEIVMLTGDNQPTAQALAKLVGVDRFEAELLPEDKITHIQALKEKWKSVMMIGDGINDAPAMAVSSLGIAMGGMGSDTAIEVADMTLIADDLSKIPWLIRYSRKVMKVIRQNIAFAIAIKMLFIILALFNLATLWMAIAADTGATLLVISNALRLLKR